MTGTDDAQAAMQHIVEFATEWATQISERVNVATAAINEAIDGDRKDK